MVMCRSTTLNSPSQRRSPTGSTAPGRPSCRSATRITGSVQHHLMSRHLKPVRQQGLKALDATEEVERVVTGRTKKVVVMLAALGLVPNAAAQHLHRLQPCLPQRPVGERGTPWRDRHPFRSGGSTVPWRTGDRPPRQGLGRRPVAASLSAWREIIINSHLLSRTSTERTRRMPACGGRQRGAVLLSAPGRRRPCIPTTRNA